MRAFLEMKVRGKRESVQVYLQVEQGQVAQAMILSYNGEQVILQGVKAVEALSREGSLDWTFTPGQGGTAPPPVTEMSPNLSNPSYPPMFSPPSAFSRASPNPRYARRISQEEVQLLERTPRRVLLMINGERSLDQIATLLQLPRETVERSLDYLRALGMITE